MTDNELAAPGASPKFEQDLARAKAAGQFATLGGTIHVEETPAPGVPDLVPEGAEPPGGGGPVGGDQGDAVRGEAAAEPDPVAEAPAEAAPPEITDGDRFRVMSPGAIAFGPDGQLFPRRDGPDLGAAPEQAYRAIAPGAEFATSEARLLASGWRPDVPELVELIAKRETLRLAVKRLGRGAIIDPTPISAAIRRADVGALQHDLDAYARGKLLAANLGNVGSEISMWSYALELAFRQCLYTHQAKLRHSLIGRDGADAEAVRAWLQRIDTWTSKPTSVTFNDYVLYP